jgi:alpha-1,2-glucosyltransferase
VKNALKSIFSWKGIITIFLLTLIMAVAVCYNTIIHPYLLADNRHYTFYIWNRFYGRHMIVRYLLIPVYIFGLYVVCKSLNGSIGSKIFFFISTTLTICLQSLLEVRYFLIPFLLLRLQIRHVSKKWSFLEFLIHLAINYVTFTIFFTREIKWENFDEPQRIIW